MKHATIAVLTAAALATSGCGKKNNDDKTATRSGASGASGATGATGATTTAPAAKAGLASARWKDQKAGPLAFDKQLWADDGHGNLQLYLFANCPKPPPGCAALRHEQVKSEVVNAACPGWTMIHMAFNPPQGEQKAGMGPLKLAVGTFGTESAPIRASMVEYTNADKTVGGQAYDKAEHVELTQVTDTTIAGSFNVTHNSYAYQGSFSATKCTCREGDGYCTEAGATAAAPSVGEGPVASARDLFDIEPVPVKGLPEDSIWSPMYAEKPGDRMAELVHYKTDKKFLRLQFIDCRLPSLKEYAAKSPDERGESKYCFDAPTGLLGNVPLWNYEDMRRTVKAGHIVLIVQRMSDAESLTDADLEAWLQSNDLAAIAKL